MSYSTNKLQFAVRKAVRCGASALLLTLALGSAPSWAYTDGPS